ncbi:MAG TPA: hypothetical protein VKB52_04045 [Rhodanobacteraceae bacterium]|nr:hypothetical protein [Rhodanobacteraceae bacterium]
MSTPWLRIAAVVATSACSANAWCGPKIVDADEAAVAHCTFLQDVNGRSVFGERLKGPAVEKAKEDARGAAAKAGATHIVWGKPQSTDVTTITGKAYRCDG